MKHLFIPALFVLSLLLIACEQKAPDADGHKLTAFETRLAQAERRADDAAAKAQRLEDELARLANTKPAAQAPDPRVDELAEAVKQLTIRVAEQTAKADKAPTAPAAGAESTPDKPAMEVEAKPAPEEVLRRINSLLPNLKTDSGTGTQRDELLGLLFQADKETRDRVIAEMREWAKAEPENKHARLGLANALVSRFADVSDDIMKQGALAAEIMKEAGTAQELDAEFYDALHFIALMKAGYPSFAPEFTQAGKDMDRALAMQANMTWEDRFADIYTAYAKWYRVQKKYDNALAKAQAGLDLAPRNAELLAEKAAIERAISGE
jgi:hypothetical protein